MMDYEAKLLVFPWHSFYVIEMINADIPYQMLEI